MVLHFVSVKVLLRDKCFVTCWRVCALQKFLAPCFVSNNLLWNE
jgi:hypothetical protein